MKIKSEISILQFSGTDCALSQTQIGNFPGADGFVIEAWMNRQNTSSNAVVFEGLVPIEKIKVTITPHGTLLFQFSSWQAETSIADKVDSWFHFSCVYDRKISHTLSIYVNGEQRASVKIPVTTPATVNINLSAHHIGRDGAGNFFKGSLALFRIWSNLENGDFRNLMNTAFSIFTPSLITQYTLCDAQGATALVNSAGNGVIGNPNAPAINLTGTANWVKVSDAPFASLLPDQVLKVTPNLQNGFKIDNKLSYINGFTVEFWWKCQQAGNLTLFLLGDNYAGNSCYLILSAVDPYVQLIFNQGYNNTVQSNKTDLDFEWHHWALTFDTASNSINFFKDSVQIGSAAFQYRQASFNSIAYLFLPGFNTQNTLAGEISELRFWDTLLTADAMQANMYKRVSPDASALAMYYPFSGRGQGSNPGGIGAITLQGIPPAYITPQDGPFSIVPFQTCCQFNGTSEYLYNNLPAGSSGDMSFSFWSKRERTNATEIVFGYDAASFGFNADNTAFFRWSNVLNTRPVGTDMGWQYWVISVNYQTTQVAIYLNGDLLASCGTSGFGGGSWPPMVSIASSNPNYGAQNLFRGSVTAVTVWNRALSRDEVITGKYKQFTGKEAGLIHYWPMEEITNGLYADLAGDLNLQMNGGKSAPVITQGNRYTGERNKILLGVKQQAEKIVADAKVRAHSIKANAHNVARNTIDQAHREASRKLISKPSELWFLQRDSVNAADRTWRPSMGNNPVPAENGSNTTWLYQTNAAGGIKQRVVLPQQIGNSNPAIDLVNNKLHWVKPYNERAVAKFPMDCSVRYDNIGQCNLVNKSVTMAIRFNNERRDKESFLFSIGTNTTGQGFYVKYIPEGYFVLGNYNTEVRSNPYKLDDKWHELFVIYKVEDHSVSFFIDNASYGGGRINNTLITVPITQYVNLGTDLWWKNSLYGNIAMAKIYGAALTSGELSSWYYGTWDLDQKGEIFWVLDVQAGQQGYKSFKRNNGTNQWWTQVVYSATLDSNSSFVIPRDRIKPRQRHAVYFSGASNNSIDLGNIQFGQKGAFVIECWVKYASTGAERSLFNHGDFGSASSTYIGFTPQNQFVFRHLGASVYVDKNEFNSQWNHWACYVYRGELIVHLNGREVGRTANVFVLPPSGQAIIGNSSLNSSRAFAGSLAFFKISEMPIAANALRLPLINENNQLTVNQPLENYQNILVNGFSTLCFDFFEGQGEYIGYNLNVTKLTNVQWLRHVNLNTGVWHYSCNLDGGGIRKRLLVGASTEGPLPYVSSDSVCAFDPANLRLIFGFPGSVYFQADLAGESYSTRLNIQISSVFEWIGFNNGALSILSSRECCIAINPNYIPSVKPYSFNYNDAELKQDLPINLAYSAKTNCLYIQQEGRISCFNFNGGYSKLTTIPDQKKAANIFIRIDEEVLYVLTEDGTVMNFDTLIKTWTTLYRIDAPANTIFQIRMVDAQQQLDARILKLLETKKEAQLLAAANLAQAHSLASQKYAPYNSKLENATQTAQAQITNVQAAATSIKTTAEAKKAAAQQTYNAGIATANAKAAQVKQAATAQAAKTKAEAQAAADAINKAATAQYAQANQLQNNYGEGSIAQDASDDFQSA